MEQNIDIAFSFIVRAYNAEQTIARALKSALAQDSSENYEVVVIDDGSTDSTADIVRSFDDKRIVFVQQENRGLSGASKSGLEAARADVVMMLDADDETLPNTIRTALRSMGDNAVDYAYGDYYEEFNGVQKRVIAQDPFKGPVGSMVWRRDKLIAAGSFSGETIFPEYELLLTKWEDWKGVSVEEPLFVYHRSSKSMTGDGAAVRDSIRALRKKFPDRNAQIDLIRSYEPLAA